MDGYRAVSCDARGIADDPARFLEKKKDAIYGGIEGPGAHPGEEDAKCRRRIRIDRRHDRARRGRGRIRTLLRRWIRLTQRDADLQRIRLPLFHHKLDNEYSRQLSVDKADG